MMRPHTLLLLVQAPAQVELIYDSLHSVGQARVTVVMWIPTIGV